LLNLRLARKETGMQATEMTTAGNIGERNRVEAVVQTLATMRSPGDSLAELAHDARNMVTALALYCDLLEEPGVLTPAFLHYGSELRLVVSASRRLVEKLVLLDTRDSVGSGSLDWTGSDRALSGRSLRPAATGLAATFVDQLTARMPNDPIRDLRQELFENSNLLGAMAGVSVAVTVEADGGNYPVDLTSEDLTRILVNLVKNSTESMRTAGTIRIALSDCIDVSRETPRLLLTVEDTGPGIPAELREKIFAPGFTSHPGRTADPDKPESRWLVDHRGLGLSITRSIVEAAGGCISAGCSERGGAQFEIELPVRRR
jgi:signal transduction histidine kinase